MAVTAAKLGQSAAAVPARKRARRGHARRPAASARLRSTPAATRQTVATRTHAIATTAHHEVDDAAHATAAAAALIGPFLLAGAVTIRLIRGLTRLVR